MDSQLIVHTCRHICMHACILTYMHTYIHTYIHTYMSYIHTYIYTCRDSEKLKLGEISLGKFVLDFLDHVVLKY